MGSKITFWKRIRGLTPPVFLGRLTAGKGRAEELSPAQARTALNVADGATANSSDAFLLARANHTGTQAISTIANLAPTLALKADLVGGVVPTSQIPAISIVDYLGTVANEAAMLGLSGQKGDFCKRDDTGTNWQITGNDPSLIAGWTELSYPAAPVASVNGQIGTVVLAAADVGASAIGHTHIIADTSGLQPALDARALLSGAAFTGNVTTTTRIGIGQASPQYALHFGDDAEIRMPLSFGGQGRYNYINNSGARLLIGGSNTSMYFVPAGTAYNQAALAIYDSSRISTNAHFGVGYGNDPTTMPTGTPRHLWAANKTGLGYSTPNATTLNAVLNVRGTTEQARHEYDAANYTAFTTSSAGNLTIAPSGGALTLAARTLLQAYTLAGVPSAAANTGASIQISDRQYRIATSDGTDWNWAGTTTAIS